MGQMGYKKERERKRDRVVKEYLKGDLTYREMEERYSVASSTIHRWVKESEKAKGPAEGWGNGEVRRALEVKESELSSDVRQLRRELEEARLCNKLLNAMIDIAEDQFEIPIRKKRGAK